jgi:hypothetical protein
MTVSAFQDTFASWPLPPCVRHSFLRREHGPDHLYPLVSDQMTFPCISRGSKSGRYFVTTHCSCADPLRLRSFKTQRRAQWAWRGTVLRTLAQ